MAAAAKTPEEVIRRHLGQSIITKAMEKEMLGMVEHVGWMVNWTNKERRIYYSCCGNVDSDRERTIHWQNLMEAAHRTKGRCPYCGRSIEYLDCNHIRQEDRYEHFHTFYRRSRADQKTLVVIGVWCGVKRYGMRRTDKAWREIKACGIVPEMEPVTVTILTLGEAPVQYMQIRWPLSERAGYMGAYAYMSDGIWQRATNTRGGRMAGLLPSSMGHTVHNSWLIKAADGTAWAPVLRKLAEAEVIPSYDRDKIDTLAAMSRHPQIEYMLQGGLVALARAAITGNTRGAINWRGKTMKTMLGVDGNELARLKRMQPEDARPEGLCLLKAAKKNGEAAKLETCMEVVRQVRWGADLKRALRIWGGRYGYMRIVKAMARWNARRTYGAESLWMDYMEELMLLGEADDASRAFPKNLNEAHAETSSRIKIKKNEKLQARISERAADLRQRYSFEAAGIVMEPFETVEEIIREGAKQRICIGMYCESYAKGKTILLKMRRKEAPGEPFHAVEMNVQGLLVQCRGYKNMTFPEDEQQVRAFWDEWNKHRKKQEVRLTISDKKREEVLGA